MPRSNTIVRPLAGFILASLLFAGVAYASFKQQSPVFIDTTNRLARGAIADARSGPASEELGCFADARSNGTFFVQCNARDAAGVTAVCSSGNADLARAGQSISDSSFILFQWDATGTCTNIRVGNDSSYSPRGP
jgi:hypothetical protein